MRAAAMLVWLFINILCFGMCGYLYLIWYQYWMYDENQRNSSKTSDNSPKTISYQDKYTAEKQFKLLPFNSTSFRNDFFQKSPRLAVHAYWSNRRSNKTAGSPSNNIVGKSNGRPRFPNVGQPLLQFDSDKYACDNSTSTECEERTAEFKKLLRKEFHRVLMGASKVFTSGLDAHNKYGVQYNNGNRKESSRKEVMCALKSVKLHAVQVSVANSDVTRRVLQQERDLYDTCVVVSSAGALLGSGLGKMIDSHDMVLRFNNAPTENYTESVGSKTTFRVLNSEVVANPEFNFLEDPIFRNISILVWHSADFSSTIEDWFRNPEYPLLPILKFAEMKNQIKKPDVQLLDPHLTWSLWTVLQDTSPYRLRRNPPSSGFIGLWFALHSCRRVRMLEYVPSTRATRRCHYYAAENDPACTLGAWHPLAQEKTLAELIRDNTDVEVFQRGIIDVPGFSSITCP